MNLNFLKFKKEKMPPLGSLRPPIFDSERVWFSALGISLLIFVIIAALGIKIFYGQYFETYRKSGPAENYDELINVKRLNAAVEKRAEFLNKPAPLPRDPSI